MVRAVGSRWRVLVLTLVACLVLTAVGTLLMPVRYVATTTVFVSTGSAGGAQEMFSGGSFAKERVKSYARAIPMPVILQPVIDELQLDIEPVELAKQIKASVPLDSVLIDISVENADPGQAAAIANAVAREFAETVPLLEDPRGVSQTPVSVTALRAAESPTDQSSPDVLRNIAIALFLGLALGAVLAVLRQQSDTLVRSEKDVRDVFDHPVIGTITMAAKKDGPLASRSDPQGPRAEAFRALRSNLRFFSADQQVRVVALSSARMGEGKSTVAANLGLAMAETGETVCLVEADLRRPRLLNYLGKVATVGLADVLIGQADLDSVLEEFDSSGMWTVGAGTLPPNPSELLGSKAMEHLVRELLEVFDRVIIDTPPLLPVTDALVLSRVVDGMVLVVGAGIVDAEEVRRALEDLKRAKAHVLGLVVNRQPVRGPDSRYSYRDTYLTDADEVEPASGGPEDRSAPQRLMDDSEHSRPRRVG